MKPLLIAFTLFCAVFTKSSFAQQREVSPAILQAFSLSYSNVKNVNWSKVNDLYKAEFVLDGQTTSIFYNAKGEVVASSRFITFFQLPMLLKAKLEQGYKDFKVTGLFEVANEEGSNYYAVVENAKTIITLKSIENDQWMVHIKKHR